MVIHLVLQVDERSRHVVEFEAEQTVVNANRELIARMEKKIQATLARVWGEETGDTPK